MIRTTFLVLTLLVAFPSIGWSTYYFGTGSVSGVFGNWSSGVWQEFWVSYSGHIEMNYDQRWVEDPGSPGTLLPEVSLDLSTVLPADWGLNGEGAPQGKAYFGIASLGFVPKAFMPPGFGPMALSLQGVTTTPPAFFFIGAPDPSGSTLDIPSASFASDGYSVYLQFSGEVIPEPASVLLLATGLGVTLAGLARVKRGGARRI